MAPPSAAATVSLITVILTSSAAIFSDTPFPAAAFPAALFPSGQISAIPSRIMASRKLSPTRFPSMSVTLICFPPATMTASRSFCGIVASEKQIPMLPVRRSCRQPRTISLKKPAVSVGSFTPGVRNAVMVPILAVPSGRIVMTAERTFVPPMSITVTSVSLSGRL